MNHIRAFAKLLFLLISLLTMLALVSCGSPPEPLPGEIRGRVVDAQGKPCEGYTVTLLPEEGVGSTAVTDRNGFFLFQDVPSGRYKLSVMYRRGSLLGITQKTIVFDASSGLDIGELVLK
jgi:hypothetical protein